LANFADSAAFPFAVSPKERLALLINGATRKVRANEIPHVLAAFPDEDLFWCPQKVDPQAPTARKDSITALRYVILDLDFDIAGREFSEDEIIAKLDEHGLPAPSVILFSGGGYHVYWSIGTLHIEKRRDYWIRCFEDITTKLCECLACLGADPQATNVNRLLRVPGSTNQKRREIARVVFKTESEHRLNDFAMALRSVRTNVVLHQESSLGAKTPLPYKPEGCTGDASQGKAIDELGWILGRVFPEGYRHHTCLNLAIALRSDGVPESTAEQWAVSWGSKHLPGYPDHEIRTTIQSVYRRKEPFRIKLEALLRLHDINGDQLPRIVALKACAATGAIELKERKALAERSNRPSLESAWRALRAFNSGNLSGICAHEEAAAISGIKPGQYARRTRKFLHRIGIAHYTRKASSTITKYQDPGTHLTVRHLSGWKLLRLASGGSVVEWLEHTASLVRRFLREWITYVSRLFKLFDAACRTLISISQIGEGDGQIPGSTSRAPPTSEGLSGALSAVSA